jgi:predicted AAA+ superfamily ATPase
MFEIAIIKMVNGEGKPMRRLLMQKLFKWKDKHNRLPLILRGARQVGKSWLLNEFGKEAFSDVVTLDFEKGKNLKGIFGDDISPQRIIELLGFLHGKPIIPQETLLVFDEVQELPRALTSLKYFAETAPEYAICCAGSQLGVALHEGTSFPVGKVDFLDLRPLNFEEFLLALNEDALINFIRDEGLREIPEPITERLTEYLKLYFVIGGMPEAINVWIETRNFQKLEEQQRVILSSYDHDFSKHAPPRETPKLQYIWKNIPSQLAKENKKFFYSLVRKGARAREYEMAMLWLIDSGLVRKVSRITKAAIPLKFYEDLNAFKLYHLDVGLLRVMSELDPKSILEGIRLFEEFKGALTEQFVLTELAGKDYIRNVYYWVSDGVAEVDFVFADGGEIYPVEVKAGENLRSKSLKSYRDRYNPKLSIRTSLANLRLDDGLLNVPLFALFNLENYLR